MIGTLTKALLCKNGLRALEIVARGYSNPGEVEDLHEKISKVFDRIRRRKNAQLIDMYDVYVGFFQPRLERLAEARVLKILDRQPTVSLLIDPEWQDLLDEENYSFLVSLEGLEDLQEWLREAERVVMEMMNDPARMDRIGVFITDFESDLEDSSIGDYEEFRKKVEQMTAYSLSEEESRRPLFLHEKSRMQILDALNPQMWEKAD